ncbi:MAG: lipocalin family protein, partial [Patulibacter sp.]|nr:lipocalin family protein [Patulibacter sp.]
TCSGPLSKTITTVGKARILDTTTNAQLQVSFIDVFGTWVYPGSTPNYVVVGLDPGYGWAVVGDPARSSAFVLSRTASLTATQRSQVTAALVKNGFDPCSLQVTPQTGGATTAGQFCAA